MSTTTTTTTNCGGMMAFFPAPNFMLQSPSENEPHHHHHHHHHHHNQQQPPPPSLSSLLPQDFHGIGMLGKRSMSSYSEDGNNGGGEEELSDDDGSQLMMIGGGGGGRGEKKRRLKMEQVKTLEKNFELGNKLEPERKLQLAKALGLQPRQIAIWFQNRRARWKTKQLEEDYDLLKRQFDALKSQNDALLSHNHNLQSQIMALKNREPTESINLNKETEGSSSNRSENSSEIKLDISRTPTTAIESALDLTAQPPAAAAAAATGRAFFPPSSIKPNGPPVAQILFQSPQPPNSVKEESSFTTMFCGIDDQTGFWPWLEQQNFN